jgi:hypothetical protein
MRYYGGADATEDRASGRDIDRVLPAAARSSMVRQAVPVARVIVLAIEFK